MILAFGLYPKGIATPDKSGLAMTRCVKKNRIAPFYLK
jgi:hypothetical protein